MSDGPKLPEEPKGNTPNNKIREGESFAQQFERLREEKKAKSKPRDYSEDGDSVALGLPDIKEPETQEEGFRLAAMKLAMMEDEILSMAQSLHWEGEAAYARDTPPEFFVVRSGGELMVDSYEENLITPYEEKASILLICGEGVRRVNAKRNNINTDRRLTVRAHMDESTSLAYREFVKTAPRGRVEANTSYFFNQEGEYKKDLEMDPSVSAVGKKKIGAMGDRSNIYESQMTEHDFEIAGQALAILRKRLVPLIPQGESNNES